MNSFNSPLNATAADGDSDAADLLDELTGE